MRAVARPVLLVLALLGSVSTLARDARTGFTVGVTVVESCELTPAGARASPRCAQVASEQWRDAAVLPPTTARPPDAPPRVDLAPATRRDERASAARVLLIRF